MWTYDLVAFFYVNFGAGSYWFGLSWLVADDADCSWDSDDGWFDYSSCSSV